MGVETLSVKQGINSTLFFFCLCCDLAQSDNRFAAEVKDTKCRYLFEQEIVNTNTKNL
jgi:hypothetical protein